MPGALANALPEPVRDVHVRWLESALLVPGCLLASALLRLSILLAFEVQPVSDFEWYYRRAVDLAEGRGLVTPLGTPTAYWPVGYPAFLSVLFRMAGPSVRAAQLANLALGIGALGLTWLIGRRLFGARAAGLALAILALMPNQLAYTALVANEGLASFLLLLGVALLFWRPARGRWLAPLAAGAVFGLACLTKPQTVIAPIVLAPILWATHRRGKALGRAAVRIGVLHLALAATVVPWLIRNQRAFGGFVFVASTGGKNLLIGNNPAANGTYPRPEAWLVLRDQLAQATSSTNEREKDRAAQALALAYLEAHPLEALARVPLKLWFLYSKDVDGFSWMQEGAPTAAGRYRMLQIFKVVAQVCWCAMLGGFVLAVGALIRRRQLRTVWLPLLLLFALTSAYLPYFGIARFHYLMVPWLALAIGAAVSPGTRHPEVSLPTSPVVESGRRPEPAGG